MVRSADIRRAFSEEVSTKWCNRLYKSLQKVDDTISSWTKSLLTEKINESILRSTKLGLHKNNQAMKKLNLIK